MVLRIEIGKCPLIQCHRASQELSGKPVLKFIRWINFNQIFLSSLKHGLYIYNYHSIKFVSAICISSSTASCSWMVYSMCKHMVSIKWKCMGLKNLHSFRNGYDILLTFSGHSPYLLNYTLHHISKEPTRCVWILELLKSNAFIFRLPSRN